jgi:hypothetical protein
MPLDDQNQHNTRSRQRFQSRPSRSGCIPTIIEYIWVCWASITETNNWVHLHLMKLRHFCLRYGHNLQWWDSRKKHGKYLTVYQNKPPTHVTNISPTVPLRNIIQMLAYFCGQSITVERDNKVMPRR